MPGRPVNEGSHLVLCVALVAAGGFSSACVRGQARVAEGNTITDDKPRLWQQATTPADAAMRTALAHDRAVSLHRAELEKENRHLVYFFDIRVVGRPRIEEVQVGARTGEIAVEHENKKTSVFDTVSDQIASPAI